MRKNLLCHRCIVVPLRVPVCTLTEVLWHINYRDELEDMRLPQGLCLARSTARLSCRRRVRIHSVNPIYQLLIVTYSANV